MISNMNLTQKHLNWTIKSHQRISGCRDESVQYALSIDHSSPTSMYIFNSKKKTASKDSPKQLPEDMYKRDGFAQHLRGPCTQKSHTKVHRYWPQKTSDFWNCFGEAQCPQIQPLKPFMYISLSNKHNLAYSRMYPFHSFSTSVWEEKRNAAFRTYTIVPYCSVVSTLLLLLLL